MFLAFRAAGAKDWRSNLAISDRTPADYFPPLMAKIGHAPFTAQCILTVDMLLQVETYKTFLA